MTKHAAGIAKPEGAFHPGQARAHQAGYGGCHVGPQNQRAAFHVQESVQAIVGGGVCAGRQHVAEFEHRQDDGVVAPGPKCPVDRSFQLLPQTGVLPQVLAYPQRQVPPICGFRLPTTTGRKRVLGVHVPRAATLLPKGRVPP